MTSFSIGLEWESYFTNLEKFRYIYNVRLSVNDKIKHEIYAHTILDS